MSYNTFSDIVSIALKNEIKRALSASHNALIFGADVWDGESKTAYDGLKDTIQREISDLETAIGEL